jgi:hypothetical protein
MKKKKTILTCCYKFFQRPFACAVLELSEKNKVFNAVAKEKEHVLPIYASKNEADIVNLHECKRKRNLEREREKERGRKRERGRGREGERERERERELSSILLPC